MVTDKEADTKAMTLRLPRDQAEELEAVAEAEGVPIAEVVREAIASHVRSKLSDRAFQKRLRERLERNKRVLDRMTARTSSGRGPRPASEEGKGD